MSTSSLTVQPLGPAIGALVSGVQLADGIDDAQRDALLAALLKHHVLFFENQGGAGIQFGWTPPGASGRR